MRILLFPAEAEAAAISEANKKDSETTTGPPIDDLEGCEDVISKEELRKLDSQPNPFNFSERVSQTTRVIAKVLFFI